MLNRFQMGKLKAENDGTPSGGGGTTTTPDTTAAPDIAKLLNSMQESMTANFSKSISDMRKEMKDANDATNTRLKMVIDDLIEGSTTTTSSTPITTTTPTPPPDTTTTTTNTNNNLVEDMIKMTAAAERRKLRESEDAKRQLEVRLEQLARDNNQIRIESAVNGAMAKLNWADGTYDIVANQMVGKAEIDADGKVKMGGMDPAQYITKFHAGNLWAQPAAQNAGSGNSGGVTRRPDGSFDLKSYDPAKVDPSTPEGKAIFNKLLQQTREQFGGS